MSTLNLLKNNMISALNPVENKLCLRSDPKSLLSLESWINSLCETYSISVELYGNILIALSEAVNNAIIHGNKNVVEKEALVEAFFDNKLLVFTVTDQGEGFNFLNLPDPTLPENLEKPQGRGVFLMNHLSDSVVYQEPGNSVEISFNI
ncbi:MAG: ATP-binding protein [Parvicellaceae bacterium]